MLATALLTGCSSGAASLSVTYTAEEGGAPVTVDVAIPKVDCDVSDAGARFQKELADHGVPENGLSEFAAFTLDLGGGDTYYNTVVRLTEDLYFISLEPFEPSKQGVTFDEHPGKVSVVTDGIVTDTFADEATLTGKVTC